MVENVRKRIKWLINIVKNGWITMKTQYEYLIQH